MRCFKISIVIGGLLFASLINSKGCKQTKDKEKAIDPTNITGVI